MSANNTTGSGDEDPPDAPEDHAIAPLSGSASRYHRWAAATVPMSIFCRAFTE